MHGTGHVLHKWLDLGCRTHTQPKGVANIGAGTKEFYFF